MANSVGLRAVALLAAAALLGGCGVRGLIYSRTVEPLMTDFDATPVATTASSGDVKTISFYVDVEWGHTGIGEIARQKGLGEIYYADLETTTVLGYWSRDVVRVYGRKVPSDSE
ncbi:MAG: TRL domain-containing protein [Gammaproteobacteria bacterium]